MTAPRLAVVAAAAALGACSGVHHVVHDGVPAPATVAVLPFAGAAAAPVRDGARALFASRLRARGYHVVELAWTDRVLSERGWLRDPDGFDPAPLPVGAAAAALGVEALAVGRAFDDSSFNIWLLRRHAFGGELSLQHGDGRAFWAANHAASTTGGFVLTSGQVFTELRAQGEHGTPMETLALVDEFVADVTATVPARTPAPRDDDAPALREATVAQGRGSDGGARLVVEVRSTPGTDVRCDLGPGLTGVPMVALPGEPSRYRCEHDLPPDTAAAPIVVHARSPWGREARLEVTP